MATCARDAWMHGCGQADKRAHGRATGRLPAWPRQSCACGDSDESMSQHKARAGAAALSAGPSCLGEDDAQNDRVEEQVGDGLRGATRGTRGAWTRGVWNARSRRGPSTAAQSLPNPAQLPARLHADDPGGGPALLRARVAEACRGVSVERLGCERSGARCQRSAGAADSWMLTLTDGHLRHYRKGERLIEGRGSIEAAGVAPAARGRQSGGS